MKKRSLGRKFAWMMILVLVMTMGLQGISAAVFASETPTEVSAPTVQTPDVDSSPDNTPPAGDEDPADVTPPAGDEDPADVTPPAGDEDSTNSTPPAGSETPAGTTPPVAETTAVVGVQSLESAPANAIGALDVVDGSYPQGVMVQHHDISSLDKYVGNDTSELREQWVHSLDTAALTPVFKRAVVGSNNYGPVADTAAFIIRESDDGTAAANAQKIFGYITPSEDVSSVCIKADDGVILFIDINQDNAFSDDEKIINQFNAQAPTDFSATTVLQANKTYRFEIHYFNWGGRGALTFGPNAGEMFPESWFSVNPMPPVAADDRNNVITGINGMMEYSVDDGAWTAYAGTPSFPGAHTVKVRYAVPQDVPLPNGEASTKTLTFTEDFNFWITVDDSYDVYINGVALTKPDNAWTTYDEYRVTLSSGKNVIAVKGADQWTRPNENETRTDGYANVSGFRAALKTADGWMVTDNQNWLTNQDETLDENIVVNGNHWYDKNFVPDSTWVSATVIPKAEYEKSWEKQITNKEVFPEDSGAQWIWSSDYDTEQGNSAEYFDSPVFFRGVIGVDPLPPTTDPVLPPTNPGSPTTPTTVTTVERDRADRAVETTIAAEPVPQGLPAVAPAAVVAPATIVEEVVPLGVPVLPKTGETSSMFFYLLGLGLVGVGVLNLRKKETN